LIGFFILKIINKMSIYKNKFNGKSYLLYRNNDGTITAFPHGKVIENDKILKNCNINDFVLQSIISNKIKGFI